MMPSTPQPTEAAKELATTLTEAELAAIEARCNATFGTKWRLCCDHHADKCGCGVIFDEAADIAIGRFVPTHDGCDDIDRTQWTPTDFANARLMAHAKQDVTRLIAALRSARAPTPPPADAMQWAKGLAEKIRRHLCSVANHSSAECNRDVCKSREPGIAALIASHPLPAAPCDRERLRKMWENGIEFGRIVDRADLKKTTLDKEFARALADIFHEG